MTKWDRLLAQLDQVFGFADRKKSSVKKLRQVFDEKTNEHVFIIEHRVLRGEHSDPRRRNEDRDGPRWLDKDRDLISGIF